MDASSKSQLNKAVQIQPELMAIQQSQVVANKVENNTISNKIEAIPIDQRPGSDNNSEISLKNLKSIAKSLNNIAKNLDIKSKFEVYEKMKGVYYIKVYNAQTNETISEFPPKKYLDMIFSFINGSGNLLIDKKV
ncbi:MAG TPA: flagellar protein FlaG [Thermodesulfobium narugense]|nr:flagellar protein FlaG [Thermodesulfobium narugense]